VFAAAVAAKKSERASSESQAGEGLAVTHTVHHGELDDDANALLSQRASTSCLRWLLLLTNHRTPHAASAAGLTISFALLVATYSCIPLPLPATPPRPP
jgi:hypothetical protein